jgi:hypothetical protein
MEVRASLVDNGADLLSNLGHGAFTNHYAIGDDVTTKHIATGPWK